MPECTTTNFSNCVSIKKRIYAFALGTSTLILSKFSTVKTHFPSSIEEHNIGNIAIGSLPLNSTTPPLAGESPIDILYSIIEYKLAIGTIFCQQSSRQTQHLIFLSNER